MAIDESTPRRDASFVAGLHGLVALVYWFALDVSIVHDFGPDKWGWFTQNLSTELLLERAVESI